MGETLFNGRGGEGRESGVSKKARRRPECSLRDEYKLDIINAVSMARERDRGLVRGDTSIYGVHPIT